MEKVIVLNADMSILRVTTYQRAICLIVTGKAELLAEYNRQIHPTMKVPKVIRLIKAVKNLWKKEVTWGKEAVHIRDNYICQYCGDRIAKTKATIDHVFPVAKGGKNSWENTVCSCFACNNKKEDYLLEEVNMRLRRQPYRPTIMEFILKKLKTQGLEEVLKECGVY